MSTEIYYDASYFENMLKKHRADTALYWNYRLTECPSDLHNCPTCRNANSHKMKMDQDVADMEAVVQDLERTEVEFKASHLLCDHIMHSEEDIHRGAYGAEDNRHAGVYFLMRDEVVTYVGQSINVMNRIQTHKNERAKYFNLYNYILCDVDQLDMLESLYIHKFHPEHNKTAPVPFYQITKTLKGAVHQSGTKKGKPKIKVLSDIHLRNALPCSPSIPDGKITGLRFIPSRIDKAHGAWELRFTSPTLRKRRDIGLGSYPNVSLSAVRVLATKARRLIREGKDPIEERNL